MMRSPGKNPAEAELQDKIEGGGADGSNTSKAVTIKDAEELQATAPEDVQKKTTKRCLVLVGGFAVVFAIGMAVFAACNDSKGQQFQRSDYAYARGRRTDRHQRHEPTRCWDARSGHTFENALTVQEGTRMTIKIRTTDGGSNPRLAIIIGGTLQSKQLSGATESETASTSVEDAVYGNESRQLVVFEVSPAIAMLNENITSFSCVTNYGALSKCEHHNSTEHHLARRRKLSGCSGWCLLTAFVGSTWTFSCYPVFLGPDLPVCILASVGYGF